MWDVESGDVVMVFFSVCSGFSYSRSVVEENIWGFGGLLISGLKMEIMVVGRWTHWWSDFLAISAVSNY